MSEAAREPADEQGELFSMQQPALGEVIDLDEARARAAAGGVAAAAGRLADDSRSGDARKAEVAAEGRGGTNERDPEIYDLIVQLQEAQAHQAQQVRLGILSTEAAAGVSAAVDGMVRALLDLGDDQSVGRDELQRRRVAAEQVAEARALLTSIEPQPRANDLGSA